MDPRRRIVIASGIGTFALGAGIAAVVALAGPGSGTGADEAGEDDGPRELAESDAPPEAEEEAPPGDEDSTEGDTLDGEDVVRPPPEEPGPIESEGPSPVTPEGEGPGDEHEPDRAAAAELERAEVTRGDDGVLARLDLGGPPPDDTEGLLLWSVELAVDGEPQALVSVQQEGEGFVTGVLDWSTGEQEPLPDDAVTIDGPTLELRVPEEELPELTGDVGWAATTQLDGAWGARIPGNPHDTDPEFAPLDE
ncbi:hypothetical protein ER308_05970 [Egibacter rhizosphaerae]|uniref:Uncharacterized protein n=1 Tax=Egibacter rhizosphaerae TaxID=1670831 RepID=A0A411YD49_9ACTN|nr:hypothetical protein [Egibacter rhizosphaerae]QBI19129.1 hypothetical protein ER308_05970 [Egibacter rhizosphaerae]